MTTLEMQKALEAKAREVGKLIGSAVPPGIGFALLIFDMTPAAAGDGGFMTWLSNADRADMLKALVEMVARFRSEELEGFTPADIVDVARELRLAAGDAEIESNSGQAIDAAWLLKVAAAAVAMGASPGLARTLATERAAEATRR